MRIRREPLRILGVRRSCGVIDRMMAAMRSRSLSSTCARASFIWPMPGSIPSREVSEPIFFTCTICSRKSSRSNSLPSIILPAMRSAVSASKLFSACSIRVSTSPMPRIRDAIRSGWKTSKSLSFSPVEANRIG